MKQRPVAIGLFVCEQVIIEARTGNVTPVNCFRRRSVEMFPSGSVPFTVFAMLSDGSGDLTLEVSVSRLDTFEEIYRRSLYIGFPGPLDDLRCAIRIRDCTFPVAGHYLIMLLADNEMVAQRRVQITGKEKPT